MESNVLNQESSSFVNEKSKFLGKCYAWLSLGMILSAISAYFVAYVPVVFRTIFSNNGLGFYILIITELVLVIALSANIRKINLSTAKLMFVFYSIVNGATLSTILFLYDISSIAYVFLASAGMFLVMSIYGLKTKKDLTSFGKYLIMALLGIIIASLLYSILTFVLKQPLRLLDLFISFAGVVIFTGLVAFDTQRMLRAAENSNDSEDYRKLSIYVALELYLDFINIFLKLLSLFGRRK